MILSDTNIQITNLLGTWILKTIQVQIRWQQGTNPSQSSPKASMPIAKSANKISKIKP